MWTRLPRASTSAAWAFREGEAPAVVPNTAPVHQQSLLLDVVQQLIALDTQGAFTGQLTEDGRIGADGPVTHVNLRQVGQLFEEQLAVAGGRQRWLQVSWTSHTLCRRQTLHLASAIKLGNK